jgi:hypothetical protein
MGRPFGTPLVKERVKLFVPKEWVVRQAKHRYVFVDVVQPRIILALSKSAYGSNKLSARFSQSLHRGLYNVKELYGLRAIDIDKPQKDLAVSVELEIVAGEGKDGNERAGGP